MKATIRYYAIMEKTVEVPEIWKEWAERDGYDNGDETIYDEVMNFINNFQADGEFIEPIGIYYGDHNQFAIAEY